MQELIVFLLVVGAIILVGKRAWKTVRDMFNPNPCGGCGKSCDGCPIAPRK